MTLGGFLSKPFLLMNATSRPTETTDAVCFGLGFSGDTEINSNVCDLGLNWAPTLMQFIAVNYLPLVPIGWLEELL